MKERYLIMHNSAVLNQPTVRGAANLPKQAYDGAKHLEQEGAPWVQIVDQQTSKVYDVKTFAKEHGLA